MMMLMLRRRMGEDEDEGDDAADDDEGDAADHEGPVWNYGAVGGALVLLRGRLHELLLGGTTYCKGQTYCD